MAVADSSFSTMIQESVEALAAILNPDGQLASAGVATVPLHSSSLALRAPVDHRGFPVGHDAARGHLRHERPIVEASTRTTFWC